MTPCTTENENNLKNNMDKKIIYSNCKICFPKNIKRFSNQKTIFSFGCNKTNFFDIPLSSSYNINMDNQNNNQEEKKNVNDCSLEEIENDFNSLKSKSQNLKASHELIDLILMPKKYSTIKYERPSNPFYKNFKDELL